MKTKALISFAVTAKLICVFVFVYAKSRFSHDAAQIIMLFFSIKHVVGVSNGYSQLYYYINMPYAIFCEFK